MHSSSSKPGNRRLSASSPKAPPPRVFGAFRQNFGVRQLMSSEASGWESKAGASSGNDSDFMPIGKIEDNLLTMHRSVFQHLKPLDTPAKTGTTATAGGAASPGLSEDMTVLSVNDKGNKSGADGEEMKPSISFACLIGMAILSSPDHRLTVSKVYTWMKAAYPYFASPAAGSGWKNSVRHNLSLNKHFVKVLRDPDSPIESNVHGKGSYWTIRPESIPEMESSIRKQGGITAADVRSQPRFASADSTGTLPRQQTSLPSAQKTSRRLPSDRRNSFEMDDQAAATMLCSLGTVDRGDTNEFTSTSLINSNEGQYAFGRRRSGAASAGGISFTTHSIQRKQRSSSAQIHAAYSVNPAKAPPKSGRRGTSVKTFAYVPSAGTSRRDLASAGIAPASQTESRLFAPRPPTQQPLQKNNCAFGYSTPENETAARSRIRRKSQLQQQHNSPAAPTDRRFFTFSAPKSFDETPESYRYTPDTTDNGRVGAGAAVENGDDAMVMDSIPSGSALPTRRKLAIGNKRNEQDNTAAAALLGLSESSMMQCS